MPTSAGPNTYGEESLVFSYDLGDLKNSYKGQPTVNFISELGNPAQEITGGEFSQYYNLVPVFETHGLVPYTLSMEIKGNKPGDCLVYMQNGSYTKYGFVGTWVTLTTEWQRFVFANLTPAGPDATWQANTPNDHRAMLATYTGYGSNRVPTVRNVQLEHGAHVTPFTTGTRSNTQGLLDLKGNSTIDLTNISFNSNAQIVFDGTNDYINLGSYLTGIDTSVLSIEIVFKSNTNTGGFTPLLGWMENEYPHGYICTGDFTGAWGNESISFYNEGPGTTGLSFAYTNGHAFLNDTNYHHVVFILQTGGYKIYVDGSEVPVNASFRNGSMTTTMPSNLFGYGSTPSVVVGAGSNSVYYSNVTVPVVKIYNRALTTSEVASNYKVVKSRFNI